MLMRLAEEFGIRVQTFQHVLEGYKVADEMATHGASASGFTDWWAYKFEVIDAIPYNGYLMWDRGVHGVLQLRHRRAGARLNTEAAKAMKYGGVPAEEAIKFVTLNPAKPAQDRRPRRLARGRQGRRLHDLERQPAVALLARASRPGSRAASTSTATPTWRAARRSPRSARRLVARRRAARKAKPPEPGGERELAAALSRRHGRLEPRVRQRAPRRRRCAMMALNRSLAVVAGLSSRRICSRRRRDRSPSSAAPCTR